MTSVVNPSSLPVTLPFPAEIFGLAGDAAAVRSAADPYRRFGRAAGTAAAGLRAISLESWQGSEGDLFRERRDSFVPLTQQAEQAFDAVATHLRTHADDLAELAVKMERLRAEAQETWGRMQNAPVAVAGAPAATAAAGAVDGAALLATWLGHLREASALKEAEAASARRAAAAVAAVPRPAHGPGPTPAAEAPSPMPPVVLRRVGGEIGVKAVVASVLAARGYEVEMEERDDGTVVVRVIGKDSIGAAPGVGGKAGITWGGKKHGLGAEIAAEVAATAAQGNVYEFGPSQFTDFLRRVGVLRAHPASAASGASRHGVLVQDSVRGELEGNVSVGPLQAGAEGQVETRLRGEFYDDGTSVVTARATAAGKVGGEVDDLPASVSGPKGSLDSVETPGKKEKYWGGEAAAALTLRTLSDGRSTLTMSTRLRKEGEDTARERTKTVAISARDAAEIRDRLRTGDVSGANRALQAAAREAAARGDAGVQEHEVVYAVEDDKYGVEGEVSDGGKVGLEAEAESRSETVESIDGVKR